MTKIILLLLLVAYTLAHDMGDIFKLRREMCRTVTCDVLDSADPGDEAATSHASWTLEHCVHFPSFLSCPRLFQAAKEICYYYEKTVDNAKKVCSTYNETLVAGRTTMVSLYVHTELRNKSLCRDQFNDIQPRAVGHVCCRKMNSDMNFFVGDFRWCSHNDDEEGGKDNNVGEETDEEQEQKQPTLSASQEIDNLFSDLTSTVEPDNFTTWSLDDPAIKQAIKEAHEFYDNDDDEEDDPGSDEWLLPICFAIDVYIEFMDVWRKNHEQNIILCDSPCLQKYNHTPVTFPRDPETRGYNRNGQYNVFAVTRFDTNSKERRDRCYSMIQKERNRTEAAGEESMRGFLNIDEAHQQIISSQAFLARDFETEEMYSAEILGIELFPRGKVDYDDFGRACIRRLDGGDWTLGTYFACYNETLQQVLAEGDRRGIIEW